MRDSLAYAGLDSQVGFPIEQGWIRRVEDPLPNETDRERKSYDLPEVRRGYAGILARQEWPGMSVYQEPEIVWRVNKKQHAGLIVPDFYFLTPPQPPINLI